MNRRILLQATAPAVVIGLLLFGACWLSAWYINRLQANMADILSQNVTSLHAAKQLEINLGQMRFYCLLYLLEPDPALLIRIAEYEENFKDWLERAKQASNTPEEWRHIRAIEAGYERYRKEFRRRQKQVISEKGPLRDFRQLANANPVRYVVEPCQQLFAVNEKMMVDHSRATEGLSRKLPFVLILLGVGGPLSGLIMGYGIARGLSRSLYQLSVHVKDISQRLDSNVAAVQVVSDGDLDHLDKNLQQVVGRVQEVAERLQKQQMEILRAQQLAAVGQLAASVAHEVRNPLTSVKMLVEAALRPHNPRPFTQDNLKIVHNEVVRLERTVQGFLDFARPPQLQCSECDLRQILDQAMELVGARARQQYVSISYDPPETPILSKVDASQLRNVFVNLFINALDAMPDGGMLTVRLQTNSDGDIQLDVLDTGKGIPDEMAGRVFTPFASTKPTGTGLGLSICKRIVEEHGGQISAQNLAEGGAQFTIRLPATRFVTQDSADSAAISTAPS
ncbi:MAG: hypothetical protein KatS3mg105_1180 [Gemmatales bacterium]|nr:MAG: hypothetical protein KatS3mg105_1180 [Gemmatales bacterium]